MGRSWSGGNRRLTNPPSSASCAEKTSPPKIHSEARLIPTIRGRNQLLQASGAIPRRVKTNPIFAVSEAMRISIGRVMVMPTPTAGPFMAAITGFFISKILKVTRPPPSRCSSRVFLPSNVRSNALSPLLRSAPAQKALPAPVTITTRTPSSLSA